jgi:hypothetical protein
MTHLHNVWVAQLAVVEDLALHVTLQVRTLHLLDRHLLTHAAARSSTQQDQLLQHPHT